VTWQLALDFLKANWKGLAIGLALGLLLGFLKPSGGQVKAETFVALTQATQSHSGGEITLPGRPAFPCPATKICPEVQPVKIVYDCTSKVDSSTAVSSSASVLLNNSQGLGIYAGAGAIFTDFKDLSGGYGEVTVSYGKCLIPLRLDNSLKTSIGISYKFK
jgi:hypothetical protein